MIRDLVMERSGGRCEAMVRLPRAWVRCGVAPVEDHHALTRARGGGVLDELGEIYHHIALCRRHHREVDNYGFDSGLMIAGSAYRDGGRVLYVGPDEFLSARYGREVALSVVPATLPSTDPGQGSREDVRVQS